MFDTIRAIPEFFNVDYDINEVYAQPLAVDLDQDFDRYAFTKHHPIEKDAISRIFNQTITRPTGELVSLSSLLESNVYNEGDDELFEQMGFRQLDSDPATGIVMEHDDLRAWLIKKNYGWVIDEDGIRKKITKAVGAKNVPRWMLPPKMRSIPEGKLLGIQVPSDVINPLRVVMLKRGRHWIQTLHLKNLKAAKEYLYPLPGADPSQKPLHERVVVISKKEEILDEFENLMNFVELAKTKPEILKAIVTQICLFISCNPLTDLHLNNVRFLADDTDTLLFLDGEPIGALAEASDHKTIEAIEQYDQGFFPILGLRNLQASIAIQLGQENILENDIKTVQKIFDDAIDKRVQVLIWQRKWHWFKTYAFHYVPGLTLIASIFVSVRAFTERWRIALASTT